ncbi:MAG: AbrB/MazE/SpoVT family DNA-binding domain-containing protein [Patescibacteria group bacterium]
MQLQPLEDIIKIQPKGLMTIPKAFRKKVGLEPPALARVRAYRGRLIIEPVRTLPYPVRTYTEGEIDAFFALDEAEGKALRRKGIVK